SPSTLISAPIATQKRGVVHETGASTSVLFPAAASFHREPFQMRGEVRPVTMQNDRPTHETPENRPGTRRGLIRRQALPPQDCARVWKLVDLLRKSPTATQPELLGHDAAARTSNLVSLIARHLRPFHTSA